MIIYLRSITNTEQHEVRVDEHGAQRHVNPLGSILQSIPLYTRSLHDNSISASRQQINTKNKCSERSEDIEFRRIERTRGPTPMRCLNKRKGKKKKLGDFFIFGFLVC
jgi:hypothetical protein